MKSKRARETTEVEDKPVVSVDVEAPAKKRKRNEDDGADAKKAKKEKRDKKFKKESRKERKDKRKDLQNLPEQDDDEEETEDTPMVGTEDKPADAPVDAEKAAKKDKKKKDKKDKAKSEETPKQEDVSADAEPKEEPKKSKKDKKKQNKSANDVPIAGAEADAADVKTEGKADRHIVFVGNLPFTATAETIKAHFASLNPVGVRCMSDPKDSKPCRGFAFVEFEKVWHMRTCLDKFHHSEFTDGTSYPRRINVELTAGGGGKTKKRQDKIKEKNQKLNENRTKRIEREKTAKEENKGNGDTRQAGADGIHPSRRAHIPGDAR
ncbi:U2B-like nuclear ribonucleoprotein [Fusarium heterosporum]|uniref:U2B-like nuclear ribonucleoprotein n=1 Tax=Fusarium heterosporum TaxID=42747 RepID=A0A8H5TPL9_FUSHE|nr:U2B-like nuclear ribonucleoprotein [Fusarium heterosporum]